MIEIRAFRPSDGPALVELFRTTVLTANAKDYTPEQLAAWVAAAADAERWSRSFEGHRCLVAVDAEHLVGFGDMDAAGYLDRLYVHPAWQGRGIATALCDRLEERVAGPVTTHASITARPFFERRGYRMVREQRVERRGVLLTNFVMTKCR